MKNLYWKGFVTCALMAFGSGSVSIIRAHKVHERELNKVRSASCAAGALFTATVLKASDFQLNDIQEFCENFRMENRGEGFHKKAGAK